MKKIVQLALIFALVLTPAYAHKVNVFAWVEGDTVYTQCKFSGGKMAQGGKISVFDDQENLLLEGVTDDQGEFSFKIPKKSELHIVLDATMGHANSWTIPLEEIQEALGEAPAAAALAAEQSAGSEPEAQAPEAAPASPAPAAALPGITMADIQKTVEQALDTRLRPMNRMLADSTEHKPDVNDILGGIGYILGLAGVGAYFHYRRKIKELEKA